MNDNPLDSVDAMYGIPQMWSMIYDEITQERDQQDNVQQVYVEEEPEQKAVDPNLSKLLANTFISSNSIE